jgi:hypothetical protein
MPDERGTNPIYLTEPEVRQIARQEARREIMRAFPNLKVGDGEDDDYVNVQMEDDLSDNPFTQGQPSGAPIDKLVNAMQAEAFGPVLQDYNLRRAAGMSPDAAEVLAKLNRGIDPTPLQFNFPPKESYFTAPSVNPTLPAGCETFKTYFIALIKEGNTTVDAYKQACAHFGVPDLEKPHPMAGVLRELPDKPGGAFRLGRGEAADRFGTGRQLPGHGEFDDDLDDD